MNSIPSVEILVLPDDCDVSRNVNQTSFLRMFERARWEALAGGPGVDVFRRHGCAPLIRKASIEHYAPVRPGDVLRFEVNLSHLGRTSFSLHQTARRDADSTLVAEGDFVLVCVDEAGSPVPVPNEIRGFFGTRPSVRPGALQHYLVGGVATAVDVQGDGPAILFIHGFPLDRTMWRHLIATLTGWRRIAPDLRGFGLSDAPEGSCSVADYADDLAGLLDVLGVEQAVVCGLSMGGYVAFEMVRRHAQKIAGLVLVSTRAEPDDGQAKRGRDDMIKLVETEGPESIVDRMLPKLLAPSSLTAMPQVVEHLRTMIRGNSRQGIVGALEAMRDRSDSTDLLGGINVPTLVVAGLDDQLIPAARSKVLADAIPGAQLTMIPEAGHVPPMEQPIPTSRVVAEFLEAVT
ncbi:MAG: alpha/beta fold hydrolase [Gemmatimonadales bacterium]